MKKLYGLEKNEQLPDCNTILHKIKLFPLITLGFKISRKEDKRHNQISLVTSYVLPENNTGINRFNEYAAVLDITHMSSKLQE